MCGYIFCVTSAECMRFSVISQHLRDKRFHLKRPRELRPARVLEESAREKEKGKELERKLKLKENVMNQTDKNNQQSQETKLTERM